MRSNDLLYRKRLLCYELAEISYNCVVVCFEKNFEGKQDYSVQTPILFILWSWTIKKNDRIFICGGRVYVWIKFQEVAYDGIIKFDYLTVI